MRNKMEWRDARVAKITQVAEDVRRIDFAVEGGQVPPFDPGSHSNFRVTINGGTATRASCGGSNRVRRSRSPCPKTASS
jgi:ferredoxin-NADP reductase